MEENKPELSRCQNCNKEIQTSKIDLHEVYCIRHMIKCSQCDNFYDRNYQEQHEEEFHKKQECPHCHLQISSTDFKAHTQECAPKVKYCEYCELNVPEIVYENHVKQCGGRTLGCDICGKSVPQKDFKKHEEQCFKNLCENAAEKQEKNGKRPRGSDNEQQLSELQHVQKRQKVEQKPRSVATQIFSSAPRRQKKPSTPPSTPEVSLGVRRTRAKQAVIDLEQSEKEIESEVKSKRKTQGKK